MPEIVENNISIISSNELECHNRIDSQFYHPNCLKLQRKLLSLKPIPFKNLVKSIKSFGAYSLTNQITYCENGIPFVRCVDIKNNNIDFSNILKIDEKAHKLLVKSEVKQGQVLLTMSGSVGEAVVASSNWSYPINSNQDVAKITLKDGIDPYYVVTFLNSKYGKFQTDRLPIGSIQQHIFLWQIGLILIPLFEDDQKLIPNILRRSEEYLRISREKYKEAEMLLLEEIGIKNIDLSNELCYEVNSLDTISANRIDAEYYQTKYEMLIEAITKHNNKIFSEIAFIDKTTNPPYSREREIPIITQKHLGQYQIDENIFNDPETECTTLSFANKYSKYVLQDEDILLYSVGAYIGKANIFNCNIKAVSGSFLTIIRVDQGIIDPYYILVLLNSIVGTYQSKRYSRATAQQYLYPTDIRKFIVPILNKDVQKKIRQLMCDANLARYQAKELLEEAKRKVEEMIENN